MKVLMLSYWFPYPPDNGARIRTYHLMKSLAMRHDVYLVSLLQEDSLEENTPMLQDICTVVSLHRTRWFKPTTLRSFLGYFSCRPRWFVDTFDPSIKQSISDAVDLVQPDVIVATPLAIVEYVPENVVVPCILDEHDCEYARVRSSMNNTNGGYARLRVWMRWKKLARWEARACRRFAAVTVVSDIEKESLAAIAPDLKNIVPVPNGVDIDHYSPAYRNPTDDTLIYNGSLRYSVNLEAVRYFVNEVYPILVRSRPNIRLKVTGRYDDIKIDDIASCPGIELTGYVDDIRRELNSSAVCIVPILQGGATRLKILEAMGAGIPVVSTSKGVEGINAKDGEHLLLGDTAKDFAYAVERLLSDKMFAQQLSNNARKLVADNYSWPTVSQSFVDTVERIAANS